MTSLSTRFLGHPRLTIPTLIIAMTPGPWWWSAGAAGLRIQPVEGARIGDRLAQVMDAGDPGDEALDAHPEARVRHRAVAADVEIPLKRLDRQPEIGRASCRERGAIEGGGGAL